MKYDFISNIKKITCMVAVLIVVCSVFAVSHVQIAEADDFTIRTTCINGVWTAHVLDKDGNPREGVNVWIVDPKPVGHPMTLKTDSDGYVSIYPEDQGSAKFSRGGFNDKVVNTQCHSTNVPAWIKDTSRYWVEGHISDMEFLNALQYLININLLDTGMATPQPAKTEQSCKDMFNSYATYKMAYLGFHLTNAGSTITDLTNIEARNQYDGFIDSGCTLSSNQHKLNNTIKLQNFLEILSEKAGHGGSKCVLFCDLGGYEPSWAKSMEESTALSKCEDIISNDYGSNDWVWCQEFHDYLQD